MDLEQLDTWLRTLKPPARVDGASMLDGYLTAIIIGPRSIPPDEWFVDLLGDRGRIATAAGKTLAAMTAIVARSTPSAMALPPGRNGTRRYSRGPMMAWRCRNPGARGF